MLNLDGIKFFTVIAAGGLALTVVTAEIAPFAFHDSDLYHLSKHVEVSDYAPNYAGSMFSSAITTSASTVTFVSLSA
jgi:hypothetical protein